MYSVSGYGRMIADQTRLTPYLAALASAVKPGSVVADIGTGPGFFALAACRAGARRVYAIEPDNVIQIAREAAGANGFADRIEFFQDLSTRVSLPERANVIISDLRGILPWFGQHLPSILDARKRLLDPRGLLIARCDTLWAAAVEVEETYSKLVGPWQNGEHGLVLSPGKKFVTNMWSKAHIKPNELLGESVCFYTLDYLEFEQSDMKAQFDLYVERPGVAHGFAVWFDCLVFDQFKFSNAPGNDGSVYGNGFFPFPEPVVVAEGDVIKIELRADLIGPDYVWRWGTTVTGADSRIKFNQSTLSGTALTPFQLRKRASTYVPNLSGDGSIDYFILSRFDGRSSLTEIAEQLMACFPERFERLDLALDQVAELSSRYSD